MSQRFSLKEQFEELELVYLETRNQLHDLERRGKIPADQVPAKHRRLMKLRAARETVYRLALAENDASSLVQPQDFSESREDAA